MTNHEIEALCTRWLTEALAEAEDARATGGLITDAVLESTQDGLSAAFDATNEDLLSNDYRKIGIEADELLKAAGLPALNHSSPDFSRLCRRLLRAKIEYLRVESARWDGEYTEALQPGSQPSPVEAETIQTSPFSVALEKYLASNPRPARTANPLKAEFLRFIETIGGDKPVGAITRQDCVAYKEHLQTVRKVALLTCVKHLSNLEGLFKWAITHGYLPETALSPARGLGACPTLAPRLCAAADSCIDVVMSAEAA